MHKLRYLYKGKLLFSSHEQMADLIIKDKVEKVLDVGCYMGFIGHALRDKKWSGEIIGLDKDRHCQVILKNNNYNQFLNLDIEKDFGQIRQKFDAVVFADVLEHLNNPTQTLEKTKQILKRGGTIYISLPNIANIYMRLHLLLGNFTYQDYGILDRDHRYFFTYASAKELIHQAHLKIIKNSSTPIPLPFLSKKKVWQKPLMLLYHLSRLLLLIKKELFAYQFIFVCMEK